MVRRGKRKLGLVIGIVGLIISTIIIYFNVPYSRLRSEYNSYLIESEENTNLGLKDCKYKLEDLPEAMQKFYNYTGLRNRVNSKQVVFDFKDVDFVNMDMGKVLKIDYSENIFGDELARFAFIDSSLYGIPFQGLDSFINNEGGMKGVVAKNITIFNIKGNDMKQSALVTWLSESIFMPSQMLNGVVEVNEIDKNSVQVSVTYGDMTVKGVYKFLDNGELIEFTTDDRVMTFADGRVEYKKWIVEFGDYKKFDDLVLPNILRAKWDLDNEEVVYFDGINIKYTFK